jgi:cystathionine gamma-synthase
MTNTNPATSPNAGFNTRAIHAGQEPDAQTGAVIPPLHLSSTFIQDGVGGLRNGYEYGRSANPTRDALQESLAALEGGARAFSFASGLAAEDTLLRAILRPGDHVVLGNDAYGGTYRLINGVFGQWGVGHTAVDLTDLGATRSALAVSGAKVLWLETPSNPTLKISDISELSALANEFGALLVVDNTFATPALQQPLALGADVVVHSTTKYLGGHSDVVGGAVITSNPELIEKIAFLHNAVGAIAAPFDSYLTIRGIKTLGIRMERHSQNALAVAKALQAHPAIERVFYPGLESHPQHALATRQMRGFGGMISVQLVGGAVAAREFASQTRIFTLAESLGGVESLIGYPHAMTHASVVGTDLAVPENLVRLSVGIEDVNDLIADITAALTRGRLPKTSPIPVVDRSVVE